MSLVFSLLVHYLYLQMPNYFKNKFLTKCSAILQYLKLQFLSQIKYKSMFGAKTYSNYLRCQ